MIVSVVVMAHRKREAFIPELLERLDAPAEVVWDKHGDRWETGRRSLLAYDKSADWHLVVQDDAVICRDLVAGLTKALPYVPPESPVALYIGTTRPMANRITQATKKASGSWIIAKEIYWGVGVCVPTATLEEMVRECDQGESKNYDSRMAAYYLRRGIPTYYTWPSLVDHRDSPSLVPGRGGRRHAHRFIGQDASALDMEWSDKAFDMRREAEKLEHVYFRSLVTGRVVSVPTKSRAAERYRQRSNWIEATTD